MGAQLTHSRDDEEIGQGIRYVYVHPDQDKLDVFFLLEIDVADPAVTNKDNYILTGGERVSVEITKVESELAGENSVTLSIRPIPDFSQYTLKIRNIYSPASNVKILDPFRSQVTFSFKIGCEGRFDCRPPEESPEPSPTELPQAIDYMAKDYDSFRRALIDLIPSKIPKWPDTSQADFGIALIELFAYMGDRLSYYQDRVANEAFLDTATQRHSVRSLVSLIDYKMSEGIAATTYQFFKASAPVVIPKGFQVKTEGEIESEEIVFEVDEEIIIYPELNAIPIFTWGLTECAIPAGTTSLELEGDFSQSLDEDCYLLFEDPENERCEIVQLDQEPVVQRDVPYKHDDPSKNATITTIHWQEEQALKYQYSIPDAQESSPLRGNIAPVSHGQSISSKEELGIGDEKEEFQQFELKESPLTYLPPETGPQKPWEAQSPRSSLEITIENEVWEEKDTLLSSDSYDKHYTVGLDEDGYATITFGDGVYGAKPPNGIPIYANYRVGIGRRGNVGRNVLTAVQDENGIEETRNPLPGIGGEDPQTHDEVRQDAPKSILRKLERAVTEEDYENVALQYPGVSRAKARFVWTGSWHTVFVSIDPIGGGNLSDAMREGIKEYLQDRKMAGVDLKIEDPRYVSLDIAIMVCVHKDHFVADVQKKVEEALSSATNEDGTKGFFHPDNFSFGDYVYLSKLYSALEAIEGVDSAVVERFQKWGELDGQALEQGYIEIGYLEVTRLKNDPDYPEHGQLELTFHGGKGGEAPECGKCTD